VEIQTGDVGTRPGAAIELDQQDVADIIHGVTMELKLNVSASVPGRRSNSTRKVPLTSSAVWPWSPKLAMSAITPGLQSNTTNGMLQISLTVSNTPTPTTRIDVFAPHYHTAIVFDSGKGIACGVNVLDVEESVLHSAAISAIIWVPPCYHTAAVLGSGEGTACGVNI